MGIEQARRKVTKTCACGCGKEFTGLVIRKYFNNACRQRAKRARQKPETFNPSPL